jgi:hypothetical protein
LSAAGEATPPVVTVNVRRLARARTGIETYMQRLIAALQAAGAARIVGSTFPRMRCPEPKYGCGRWGTCAKGG